MDRGIRQPQQFNNNSAPAPQTQNQNNHPVKKPGRFGKMKNHRLLNFTYIALLFSVTIIIVGVVSSIFLFDGTRDKESRLIDKSKYQAVFVNDNNRQVHYFGKIVELNNKYLTLTDIYYVIPVENVQPNSNSNGAQNLTIKKLGCEIHRPQDLMIINRDQVVFWENLKDDSSEKTVPGAIKKLGGQKQECTEEPTTNSPSQTNNNAATNTPSTPATTEPAAGSTDPNTGN